MDALDQYKAHIGEVFNDFKIIDAVREIEYHNGLRQAVMYFICECQVCHTIHKRPVHRILLGISCTDHSRCIRGKVPVKFHHIYRCMHTRCEDPKSDSYRWYGGKGIQCEWKELKWFTWDMLDLYKEACEVYGEENIFIERIDPNKNYCKENCKWVHVWDQGGNKENNVLFKATSPSGRIYYSKNVFEFCRRMNITKPKIGPSESLEDTVDNWHFERISREEYKSFWDSYVFVEKQTVLNILDGFYEKYKSRPDITQGCWVKITLSDLEKYFKDRKFAREEIDMLVSPNPNRFGLKIYYHSKLDTFFLTK